MSLVLNAGDCGSWVVDESTCEVYGHVVASDAMGDTYVVPLNATLQDMEANLGAAVALPTAADIHTWVAQHAKVAAEQIEVPVASKKKKVAFNDSKNDRVESAKDLRKLAGQSFSPGSAFVAPPAMKTSVPVMDHCNFCNAKFEGSSQDVRSNLLLHWQTCLKQNKHPAFEVESPTSQSTKNALNETSKSSPIRSLDNVQQKDSSHTLTQQPGSISRSMRSIYSNFRKKSVRDSQQKDESKVKRDSHSGDGAPSGSTSSTKRVATISPTSTAKDSNRGMKDSTPRKDRVPPPFSKNLPTTSSRLPGRNSRDLSPRPTLGPRTSSLPAVTPSIPYFHQGKRNSATPLPRPNPAPVHGHNSSHESSSDHRHQAHPAKSEEVSYEGYTFTKCKSHHTNRKESWAVAQMIPMPVSQKDLKDQIKKNKKKHISALDEYNDERMKGFKKKQVDNLIRECTKIDGDYGYEYELASIKLDSRKTKGKSTETVSMQVILKRQLIAGFPRETSAGPTMDVHAKLPSQIMDLTREDGLATSRDYGRGRPVVRHWGADVPFTGYPEHSSVPMSPGSGRSFAVPFVDNRPPIFQAAPYPLGPIYSPAHGMTQPPSAPPLLASPPFVAPPFAPPFTPPPPPPPKTLPQTNTI